MTPMYGKAGCRGEKVPFRPTCSCESFLILSRSMRSFLALACVAALATGLAACGSGDDETGDGGPRVVATTTQLADIARNIAGDRASVTEILTPNSDPHDYEPRPGDARALADAGLVLQSGSSVDEWLGDLVKSAGADAQVVTLIDDVHRRTARATRSTPTGGRTRATSRSRSGASATRWRGSTGAGPRPTTRTRRPTSATGGARHRDRALHERDPGRAAPSGHQPRRARLLRRPLGITVVGAVIPALSTEARASAGETRALVETIRREHVSTIFPESSVNPKLEKAIAAEAGRRSGRPCGRTRWGPRTRPDRPT